MWTRQKKTYDYTVAEDFAILNLFVSQDHQCAIAYISDGNLTINSTLCTDSYEGLCVEWPYYTDYEWFEYNYWNGHFPWLSY